MNAGEEKVLQSKWMVFRELDPCQPFAGWKSRNTIKGMNSWKAVVSAAVSKVVDL